MKLIVSIKIISSEDGGLQNSIVSGYRSSIRTANSGFRDCVFNLPSHVQLNPDGTYNNVQIELLNPSDKFAVQSRIYIYEGHRMIAEGIINKIIN